MIFRQITHDDLGCASYLIGDEKAGVAAVVDPRFEIEEYLSAGMLRHARDLPGAHVQGSVLEPPFAAGTFDVVVSAWVIEAVPDPRRAVSEYPPDDHARRERALHVLLAARGLVLSRGQRVVAPRGGRGFAGQFLDTEHTPWHDCERSHRLRFAHGLTTEVELQGCCDVGPPVLP